MTRQNQQQRELAGLVVETLDLEDVDPASIDPEWQLFGVESDTCLGLDSIDALELALAIDRHYGVKLQAEDENNKAIFATLNSLCSHIDGNR